MFASLFAELAKRAAEQGRKMDMMPPGFVPPDDPIYVIPPEEMQAEYSIRADYLAETRDWGHENLGIEALHNAGHRGAGVLVCVADTGIDYNHPDLKARIILDKCRDFTGSSAGFLDRQGHGTHCSGIVAASNDGSGMIGAAPEARLMSSKVLSDNGSGASTWIAAGIRHAVDQGADIVSLSLGGPSPDSATRQAIQYAASKGVWIVCAAGNDGGPASGYPGHYPESIAVAATDRDDKRASFSTINRENDVAAPGVNIMSTLPQGRYGSMSGTSMATPYVAGCLALLRGAIKKAGVRMPTQQEVLSAISQTSRDLPPTGPDANTGSGLIDTAALIKFFVKSTPTPPNPPTPPNDPSTWEITLVGNGTKPSQIKIKGASS